MNVGIGTEAAQSLFQEYLNWIFGTVYVQSLHCMPSVYPYLTLLSARRQAPASSRVALARRSSCFSVFSCKQGFKALTVMLADWGR